MGRATAKARDLVRMSVMRASLLSHLQERSIDVHPAQCLTGAWKAFMPAEFYIAVQGFDVYFVRIEPAG